ncbi:MAG: hypothetical protein ACXWID_14335 [Pyrinomonadaceae bacterium]
MSNKKAKIDMSAAAVTARLKRACGLGDIERVATTIRSLVAEIRGEQEIAELAILIAEREGRLMK